MLSGITQHSPPFPVRSTEQKFDCDGLSIHNSKLPFGEFWRGSVFSLPSFYPAVVPACSSSSKKLSPSLSITSSLSVCKKQTLFRRLQSEVATKKRTDLKLAKEDICYLFGLGFMWVVWLTNNVVHGKGWSGIILGVWKIYSCQIPYFSKVKSPGSHVLVKSIHIKMFSKQERKTWREEGK